MSKEITPIVKQYIVENKQLIINEDFEKLYSIAARMSREGLDEFTALLWAAGYNPIAKIIPPYYYSRGMYDKSIGVMDGVTRICINAFTYCDVDAVVLPMSLETIEISAFYNCNIRVLWLPTKKPLYLGNYAFKKCTQLREVSISNNVTYIGDHCFSSCEQLGEINFTGTVKEWNNINFGDYPFSHCYSLKKINCIDGEIPLEE